MVTRRRLLQMAGGVGAVVVSRVRTTRAADLDEVKIGTPAVISDAPLFIGEHKGYWKEQGLKVTLINMQTGPHMIAPLGTGQIDIAAAATSAGLYNAEARGIGVKIVADKGSNLPGYAYVSLLIRKELVDNGKFKTMKDLKGLKIAEPGKGGSTGSTVNEALKSAGLKYDDVTHVYLGFPEMVTGLRERRHRRCDRARTVQHVRPRKGHRRTVCKRRLLSAPDHRDRAVRQRVHVKAQGGRRAASCSPT